MELGNGNFQCAEAAVNSVVFAKKQPSSSANPLVSR